MKDPFHWVVLAALVTVGWLVLEFFAQGLLGYWFWKHIDFFELTWVLLPIVAFKLRSKQVRSHFSIFALQATRNALLTTAIVISVGFFFHYEKIRDAIGHRYVDGYYTTAYEGVGDTGDKIAGTDPHTATWFPTVGLWLFEWGFIASCVLIPVLTWSGSNKALSEAIAERRDEHV